MSKYPAFKKPLFPRTKVYKTHSTKSQKKNMEENENNNNHIKTVRDATNDFNFQRQMSQLRCQLQPFIEAAAMGNLSVFESLYNAEPRCLSLGDPKGQRVFHHAAANGRVIIMDFILEHGGDINVQDEQGYTPLHAAIASANVTSIQYLLANGAASSILCVKEMAPLHLATRLGNLEALEALLKHDDVDIDQRGPQGGTAVHVAALHDNAECIRILLDHGAKPCLTCNNGKYPIHLAASNASAKVLESFVRYGEKRGYTREYIMNVADKEGNVVLHAAVNSGNLEAVRVCFEAGSYVDSQQTDDSTPVHYAASQGLADIISLMFEMQPERMETALSLIDVQGMTPLHRAAIFNHTSVVKMLVEKGANINVNDNQERTPLLLAASNGGWQSIRILLSMGADMSVTDNNRRNIMHLAILSGGRLNHFAQEIDQENSIHLLDVKDDRGCTPLHYASKSGLLAAINDLIDLGAVISPKDNEQESPLHFATRYGRYNTCRRLLDSPQGANIINESNGRGLTGLHIAAQNGHNKIVNLLMQKGGLVHRDFEGMTPLHHAAMNGYPRCMRLLLSVDSHQLNAISKSGDTALHLAAREGKTPAVSLLLSGNAELLKNNAGKTFLDLAIEQRQSDVAMAVVAHERWIELMDTCSAEFSTPMNGFIKNLPDVCLSVLDRCQSSSAHEKGHLGYNVTYNFKYLQCPMSYIRERREQRQSYTPMFAMNAMVRYSRVECLSHPVCVNFLDMKWNAYGRWVHLVQLLIYVLFLGILTYFIVSYPFPMNIPSGSRDVNDSTASPGLISSNPLELSRFSIICLWIIGVFSILNMFKEIAQMAQQRLRYLADHTNLLEWMVYITCLVFTVPFLLGQTHPFQWEVGTVAVFIAWFNLLLYLQNFDFFGIYVVMFLEILHTMVKVLCVFSILFIAFGLAFFTVMNSDETKAFSTPGLAIVRTAMMLLELDYMASFNDPHVDGKLEFSSLTYCLLAVFVLFMPILLINLMIGLAVGDIEAVQRDARLKRLAMQVSMHTDLERKLPQSLLDRVDKMEYTVHPNCNADRMLRFLWRLLPEEVARYDWTENACQKSESSFLFSELHKQKSRLKEVVSRMDKQTELLRLIVQKMEINTEDDYQDEGDYHTQISGLANQNHIIGWSTPRDVMRQTSVVTTWKKVAGVDPSIPAET